VVFSLSPQAGRVSKLLKRLLFLERHLDGLGAKQAHEL
jgi:hypothetical protein